MAQIVGESVWVGGKLLEAGTPREQVPAEIAGQVGDHVWVEEGEKPVLGADGESLTGLRSAVHIGGKLYEAGTVPPDDVLPLVGSHMWVPGFAPPGAEQEAGETAAAEPVEVAPAGGPLVNGDAEVTDGPADETAASEQAPEPAETEGEVQAEGDDGDDSEPGAEAPEPPPAAGKGSSEQAWRDYAAAVGVDIEGVEDRKGIRAAIEAAGKPV